jgi:hypothetical protein
VTVSGLLDESHRPGDGLGRVVLQPVGEGEVEEQLGVGRSLDLGEQRRGHLQGEVALDGREVDDDPVVHPQPVAMAERMAVGLLDR